MNEQLTQIYGYLHGMWRYRWSSLLIAWVVAIFGWLFVFSLPNQYNATAVVYIDTSSVIKPLLKGLAPETDAFDEINIMSRVLLSRKNLLTVIRETDMDLEVATPQERERLVEHLAAEVNISGGGGNRWERKNNLYEISYTDNSPDRVYQVVSNLLNTMIEDTLNSTRTDTASAQKFLDTQIAEYEQRLSVAEQELAKFKKSNVGYMPDEKGSYYSRLQRAQDSVSQTRSALRLAEQRYAQLQKQLKGESPLLDSGSYTSSTTMRLRQYREQLQNLLSQYTEQHPDVISLQSKIEELESKQEAGVTEVPAAGEADTMEFNPVFSEMKVEVNKAGVEVETLKIQLAEQEQYVDKLRSSIDIIPEVEAQLSRLNRDYEVTRERYLDLVERRESAKLAQDAGQSTSEVTFRVIEPPIVPSRPSGPNRVLYLLGALVVAIGAGLGWGFLRYLLQPTFIDMQQLGNKIGLPVLGVVSLYLSPEHRRRRRYQLASFLSVALLLGAASGAVLWQQERGVAIMDRVIDEAKRL